MAFSELLRKWRPLNYSSQQKWSTVVQKLTKMASPELFPITEMTYKNGNDLQKWRLLDNSPLQN
jgi:hypothetical protein